MPASRPTGVEVSRIFFATYSESGCAPSFQMQPECPVDAIKPDTEPGLAKWLVHNREYAEKWPNITAKKSATPDADTYRDERGKFDKYFSAKPGEGD